jgi:hypothetical protein
MPKSKSFVAPKSTPSTVVNEVETFMALSPSDSTILREKKSEEKTYDQILGIVGGIKEAGNEVSATNLSSRLSSTMSKHLGHAAIVRAAGKYKLSRRDFEKLMKLHAVRQSLTGKERAEKTEEMNLIAQRAVPVTAESVSAA